MARDTTAHTRQVATRNTLGEQLHAVIMAGTVPDSNQAPVSEPTSNMIGIPGTAVAMLRTTWSISSENRSPLAAHHQGHGRTRQQRELVGAAQAAIPEHLQVRDQ